VQDTRSVCSTTTETYHLLRISTEPKMIEERGKDAVHWDPQPLEKMQKAEFKPTSEELDPTSKKAEPASK